MQKLRYFEITYPITFPTVTPPDPISPRAEAMGDTVLLSTQWQRKKIELLFSQQASLRPLKVHPGWKGHQPMVPWRFLQHHTPRGGMHWWLHKM